jgi:heptosyltransferase II
VTIDRANIRRLVLRAPNWLGDAVMALPAMAAVRGALPGVSIAVAGLPSIVPVFQERTDLAPDEVVVVERATEVGPLRAGSFDAALLMPNSFRTAWNVRRAGIPQRWGYAASFRRPLLTHPVARPRGIRHQAAYYLELVRGLGFDAPETLPAIRVSPETAARARALLLEHGLDRAVPLVGMAPGAAYGHAKRWPPTRVAELAGRLGAQGAIAVLVGAAGDREAGREIESTAPPGARIVNLIGRTDLRLLVGLMSAFHAFVSNDSGAMHLAAAVGIPVAAIFGPTDERVTAPLGDHDVLLHQVFCRPCMLRDCPIDHRCMKGVTVDAVHAAVTRRLAAHADSGRRR